MKSSLLRKCFSFSDIITTDIIIYQEIDLRRILYLLRLSRKPESPFEVRIVSLDVHVPNISALAEIFQEINPEVCALNLGFVECLTMYIFLLYFLLSLFTHKCLNNNASRL